MREPFQLDGTEVNSSASIGITFSSVGYETPDEVLRDADIAMYRAKAQRPRAPRAVRHRAARASVATQVRLEADLRQAIEHDQITLAYQPIFDLGSGRIVSFEALARWTHAERGAVPPQRFIAVAEESGLIGKLTERILSMACQQLRRWQRQHRQRRSCACRSTCRASTCATAALAEPCRQPAARQRPRSVAT